MPARRLPSFLYRRLSRWITCEFRAGDSDEWVRLRTKYDVSSFADVFCRPFYWQCFHLMKSPPSLIVDCGAHCGHFALLAHQCVVARFPDAPSPKYLLIEPNPLLADTIRRNISDGGLAPHAELVQALLGLDASNGNGSAELWVNTHNFLVSSFERHSNSKPYQVPIARLGKLIGDREIDVLKIDIEGGEFGLIKNEPEIFDRVRLLLMEAHGTPEMRKELSTAIQQRGLRLASDPMQAHGFELLTFERAQPRTK